jgi:16S rRNA (guanine527-N7)-methyltransferase
MGSAAAERFHVKHLTILELREQLHDGLRQLQLSVPEKVADQCVEYLTRVLSANESVNLTGISDPRNAVRLHLLDSLAAIPELLASPAGALLDLGTGGGFPGVPLGVASGRRTVLLDSVAKKTKAVARALNECGIGNVSVLCGRAEEVAHGHERAFAAVVCRAVAPLSSLVELSEPFVEHEGRLLALKGPASREEVSSGDRAAEIAGFERTGRRNIVLPSGGEQRTIFVYEKMTASAVGLPRRTGLARRRPLG